MGSERMRYQGGSIPELETPEEAKRDNRNPRTSPSEVGRPHNDEELAKVQREMIRDGMQGRETVEVECPLCKGTAEKHHYKPLDTEYIVCQECDEVFEDGELIE